ncbi:MAG: MOSC domain-containing protein [Chloroflexota bacterium]|nr:MOSC domain-containing protein [Chloroflexota bacterium]
MARVLSVNIGQPRMVERNGELVPTSIWKMPVAERLPVRGVHVGDDVQSGGGHGGPDKAVYAYASEDAAWWSAQLGRDLGPGAFGENLTLEGLDLTSSRVGDRWRVGTALLEVAGPRMPCWKLELKMGEKGFIERFTAAGRPGAYLRIVEEGSVGPGDELVVVLRADGTDTMGEAMRRKAAATPA